MVEYSIGEFAKKTGLTVRTLHYYDEIGILKPSKITDAGRRIYSDNEFVTLQRIVTLKYLGFSLEQIKHFLDSDRWQLKESLSAQRKIMLEEKKRIEHVLKALDHALYIIENNGEVDTNILISLINSIQMENIQKRWLREMFDEQKVEKILNLSEEKQLQIEQRMVKIFEELKKHYNQNSSHKEVEPLFNEVIHLIEEIAGDLSFLEQAKDFDIPESENFLFHSPFTKEEEEWVFQGIAAVLKERGIHIDDREGENN